MPIVVRLSYCFSTIALLKWLEIIFSILILALVHPGHDYWGGYAYLVFVGAFSLAVAGLTLLLYFINFHSTLASLPWRSMEIAMSFLCVLVNLAGFGVAVYATAELFNNRGHHPYFYGDYREWRNKMAAVSAFTGANGVLFLFSCLYAQQRGVVVIT